MELTNEFTVPVPLDRAWEVLNDVELIAPCLPGAELQEIEGDDHRGIVKVKVGPITAQYKGTATFTQRDRAAGKLVIDASGRDTRGQGSASAIITVTMAETDGSTSVQVNTDLTIKGKVAQFGRGMLADVSAKLLDQFVACLETKLEEPAGGAEPASDDSEDAAAATTGSSAAANGATSGSDAATGARQIQSAPAEPVDLLGTAGSPVAKRLGPVVALFAVLLLLGWRRSRRRRAARS